MNLRSCVVVSLWWLTLGPVVHADPIHAVGGGFWHHATGWVFPTRIAEFELVGIPQDVAGSDEAVAYYAREVNGTRVTVSIDVHPAELAISETVAGAGEPGRPLSEGTLTLHTRETPSASRSIYETRGKRGLIGVYSVETSTMRVRIRFADAPSDGVPMMDAFVRTLDWTTFTSAPTPR